MNIILRGYHGSRSWSGLDDRIRVKAGRYQNGAGLNLTTSFARAKSYGSKVVLIEVELERPDEPMYVSKDALVTFTKSLRGLRKKREILEDIEAGSEYKRGGFPPFYLNNLLIGYEVITPMIAQKLAEWLVKNNAPFEITSSFRNGGYVEQWAVIYDLSRAVEVEPKSFQGYGDDLNSFDDQIKCQISPDKFGPMLQTS